MFLSPILLPSRRWGRWDALGDGILLLLLTTEVKFLAHTRAVRLYNNSRVVPREQRWIRDGILSFLRWAALCQPSISRVPLLILACKAATTSSPSKTLSLVAICMASHRHTTTPTPISSAS